MNVRSTLIGETLYKLHPVERPEKAYTTVLSTDDAISYMSYYLMVTCELVKDPLVNKWYVIRLDTDQTCATVVPFTWTGNN